MWVDSSFAIEWLLGTDRAKGLFKTEESLHILPQQYAEILCFFVKEGRELVKVIGQLEVLELKSSEKHHLQIAAILYVKARTHKKCKASLADAILAAVALEEKQKILSFDHDFHFLGFKHHAGVWSV